MKMFELMELLESFAPQRYACSWDNVGLLVGRKDQEIKKVIVALDATNDVVARAIEEKADLIITHHPMIFSSMKRVNDDGFLGTKIMDLVEHHIAEFAMHTNFDVIGMADLAGRYLGFPEDAEVFEVTECVDGKEEGIGRMADLECEMTLAECAEFVKKALKLEQVLVFGNEKKMVKKAVISPGSGRSMFELAAEKGADVLITGDIGHHEGLDAMDMGLTIIEAGHYGTEYIFIDYVTDFLKEHTNLEVIPVKSGSPYKVI
ncbi:MAG: Nif3-like dinuclear metal center hexameric protein [Lachnospiraceae bacterium]|nr:Nif3-like dinuclear metal center hexameric protein [Lachnospiraceae bacterium]